jgi:hypothetical protein
MPGAAPDVMLGSVQAVTEEGLLVAASATGSQLGPYVSGAGHVILVVGSQKIVPDFDAAMRRISDVVFPFENAQVQAQLGMDTRLEKLLVWYGVASGTHDRRVLVRQPVGVTDSWAADSAARVVPASRSGRLLAPGPPP